MTIENLLKSTSQYSIPNILTKVHVTFTQQIVAFIKFKLEIILDF